MSDPLMTTIVPWPTTFAPRDWIFCEGQIVAITNFTAVYSLIGTIYGGDGRTSFGIPDLRGRSAKGVGTSPFPDIEAVTLGELGGFGSVQLTTEMMPAHTHTVSYSAASDISSLPVDGPVTADVKVNGTNAGTTSRNANSNYLGETNGAEIYATAPTPNVFMAPDAVTVDTSQLTVSVGPTASNIVNTTMSSLSLGNTGAGIAYDNRSGFLGLHHIMNMEGIYPPRP